MNYQGISESRLGEALLVRIIEKKLDASTRKKFESTLGIHKMPRLEYLLDILADRPNEKKSNTAVHVPKDTADRKIVNKHLDDILDYASVSDEVKRKLLVDVIDQSWKAIKDQGISDSWLGEVLLVRIIEKKLDAATREFLESTLRISEMPRLEQLLDFLEDRINEMSEKCADDEPGEAQAVKETQSSKVCLFYCYFLNYVDCRCLIFSNTNLLLQTRASRKPSSSSSDDEGWLNDAERWLGAEKDQSSKVRYFILICSNFLNLQLISVTVEPFANTFIVK